MAGKELDRIHCRNKEPGGLIWTVKVAGTLMLATAAAAAVHGFSVVPLGTRGSFEERQEVPGRLTSCLSSLSQAREREGRGGLVQPN